MDIDFETLSDFERTKLQRELKEIKIYWFDSLHKINGIDESYRPWTSSLSPSALYSCSLRCRKKSGIKTPEIKWTNVKRWSETTPNGFELPEGVHLSIKRKEEFVAFPDPHFNKIDYIIIMLPYGNIFSMVNDKPITEEWLLSKEDGQIILDKLMKRDAANPIKGYFECTYKYMIQNPDQVGIHLKRKKK